MGIGDACVVSEVSIVSIVRVNKIRYSVPIQVYFKSSLISSNTIIIISVISKIHHLCLQIIVEIENRGILGRI